MTGLMAYDDIKVHVLLTHFVNDKWISFVAQDGDGALKETKNEMDTEEINDQDVRILFI